MQSRRQDRCRRCLLSELPSFLIPGRCVAFLRILGFFLEHSFHMSAVCASLTAVNIKWKPHYSGKIPILNCFAFATPTDLMSTNAPRFVLYAVCGSRFRGDP